MFDRCLGASRIVALLTLCGLRLHDAGAGSTHLQAQLCGKERWAVKTGAGPLLTSIQLLRPANGARTQRCRMTPNVRPSVPEDQGGSL